MNIEKLYDIQIGTVLESTRLVYNETHKTGGGAAGAGGLILAIPGSTKNTKRSEDEVWIRGSDGLDKHIRIEDLPIAFLKDHELVMMTDKRVPKHYAIFNKNTKEWSSTDPTIRHILTDEKHFNIKTVWFISGLGLLPGLGALIAIPSAVIMLLLCWWNVRTVLPKMSSILIPSLIAVLAYSAFQLAWLDIGMALHSNKYAGYLVHIIPLSWNDFNQFYIVPIYYVSSIFFLCIPLSRTTKEYEKRLKERYLSEVKSLVL